MLIENFQLFPIRARFLEFESIFVSLLIGIDWKFIIFFTMPLELVFESN
jgi:hypothetical protein